jgi:endonuclease/exonuclease/phosphatase (EEP) superfamily protein YafD
VTGVLAVALTAVTLPVLAARATGRKRSLPRLAALAPLAALVAVASVALAATASWWLALLLAIPAVPLLGWQLPPARRGGPGTGTARHEPLAPGQAALTLRVLTLNVMRGRADPAVIVAELARHDVDVLALQELTPEMADRLAAAGIAALLPACHLDPRPGSGGTGLWARWPLIPLPPVAGLPNAAPRARTEPGPGWPLTLTAVHPAAPRRRQRARQWRRDLDLIRLGVAGTGGHQVLAGDFNASRDHRPFRDLLAAGFLDCADAARRRPWPGFTWPSGRGLLPVMRLDHVLVSRPGASVRSVQLISVPGTDHRGVLTVIDLAPVADAPSGQPPGRADATCARRGQPDREAGSG